MTPPSSNAQKRNRGGGSPHRGDLQQVAMECLFPFSSLFFVLPRSPPLTNTPPFTTVASSLPPSNSFFPSFSLSFSSSPHQSILSPSRFFALPSSPLSPLSDSLLLPYSLSLYLCLCPSRPSHFLAAIFLSLLHQTKWRCSMPLTGGGTPVPATISPFPT